MAVRHRRALGAAIAASALALTLVPTASASPEGSGERRGGGNDTQRVTTASFPDPGFLKVGDTYYLYRTGDFAVATSTAPDAEFAVQSERTVAPGGMPSWWGARDGGKRHQWAPDVIEHDGRYLMYFSASKDGAAGDCAGVLASDSPVTGFATPITDGEEVPPLRCAGSHGTVIDPSVYESKAGDLYLLYKLRTYRPENYSIMQVPLTDDGLQVEPGARPRRLVNGGTQIIEAPSVVKHGKSLWMFVSRKNYMTCDYFTQVFRASGINGPFTSKGELQMRKPSGRRFCGPGGADVIKDGRTWRIAFHEWSGSGDARIRPAWTGTLAWNRTGVPYLTPS